VADPRLLLPSRKVTEPVGVPAPLLTVAVNVKVCPAGEGLADELTAVVVG
jgi:hypothetical protein